MSKQFPDQIGWHNWGALMCDGQLFEPLVRAVCARHQLPFHRLEAGFPGTHAVFVVDGAAVVKLYAPLGLPDAYAERRVYAALANHPLPLTPRYLGEGELEYQGRTWSYIACEYIEGSAVREVWPGLTQAQRQELARSVAEWAQAYHRLPDLFSSDLPLSASGWRRAYASQLAHSLDLLADGGWPEALLESLRALAEALAPELRDGPLALVHGDLTEDHLLIAPQRRALIDFADSRMAPVAYEWMALWFGLFQRDPEAFIAYLSACGTQWNAQQRSVALGAVLVHNYGAPTLLDAWGRQSAPPQSTAQLLEALWPPCA